jgi:hypothetical protein
LAPLYKVSEGFAGKFVGGMIPPPPPSPLASDLYSFSAYIKIVDMFMFDALSF